MIFRSSCTFHDRERWIGLFRPDDTPACGCINVTMDFCEECRQNFTWVDESELGELRFSDEEPAAHEACVRVTSSGLWAGYPCDRALKSVCKRGNSSSVCV